MKTIERLEELLRGDCYTLPQIVNALAPRSDVEVEAIAYAFNELSRQGFIVAHLYSKVEADGMTLVDDTHYCIG